MGLGWRVEGLRVWVLLANTRGLKNVSENMCLETDLYGAMAIHEDVFPLTISHPKKF